MHIITEVCMKCSLHALMGWMQKNMSPSPYALFSIHFLLSAPIERSSKLRTGGSSREPLAAVREREEDLGSRPDERALCIMAGRLLLMLLETSRLERAICCSLGSTEELGRLLEAMPLFKVLPLREDDARALSESIT